jgi:hypothetical protein
MGGGRLGSPRCCAPNGVRRREEGDHLARPGPERSRDAHPGDPPRQGRPRSWNPRRRSDHVPRIHDRLPATTDHHARTRALSLVPSSLWQTVLRIGAWAPATSSKPRSKVAPHASPRAPHPPPPPRPGAPKTQRETPRSSCSVAQCPIGNPTHRPRRSTCPPVASNVTPSRQDAARMVRQVVSPASSGPLCPDAPVRKSRFCTDLRDDPGGIRTPDPRFRSYMLTQMQSLRLSPYVAKCPRDRASAFADAKYLIDVSRHTKPNFLCAFW